LCLSRPHGAAEVKMLVPRRPDSLSPFPLVRLTPVGIHRVGLVSTSELGCSAFRCCRVSQGRLATSKHLARRSCCPRSSRLQSSPRARLDCRAWASPSRSTQWSPPAARPVPLAASFRAVQQRRAADETSLRSASPLKPDMWARRETRPAPPRDGLGAEAFCGDLHVVTPHVTMCS